MAIDPTTTTTVKVSELASAGYNTTDLIPHEVAGILKKGNLQDLATFIGSIIDVEGSVGFRAVNVTDGQTLPATTEEEFILVGPGTFPNVGGGSAITTTEPLNALVSNGTYWFIGVEIPIAASGAWGSIQGNIETQTDLQDALDLKADLVDGKVPASQLPSYVDDVVEVANYAALPSTGETGKIYITIDTNKVYRWSGSAYIEIAADKATWGLIDGTLSNQTDLQNALNAKFNNPTGNTTQYIAGDGSLVSFPIAGQAGTIVREIRNTTGSTLAKGTIVYISGASGNKPTVSKALATSDSTSAQTFGMVQASISNNSNGYVVCMGDLTGLDTSAISEGAQLYLSSTTAGAYTTTKQLAPAHLVYIGVVTRSHATQGQIEVKIQNGYELDEIHDVAISSKANNQILAYESATDLWKNKSIATVLGYTPANDASVVKVTTDQNVRGIKTFLGDQTATTLKLIVADYYNDGFITSDNGMLRLLNGSTELFNLASTGDLTAKSFVKTGGTSSQFLKADGSVDSTTYQTALTNPVTGTGTTNYLPKFTGSTALGNSVIYDDGTNIAIGTTTALTGGGTGKWITLQGTAAYSGGIIGAINGVAKMYVYSESGFAKIQGASGEGVRLDVNGGTAALTAFSNGNVGINTTTDAGYKLDVNGTGRFSGNLTLSTSDSRFKGGDASGRLIVSNSDTSAYVSINGSSNATPNNIGIITNSEITFNTGASYSERMRITSGGYLLVGTTTSLYGNSTRGNLELNGSASSILALKINDTIGCYLYTSNVNSELYSNLPLTFAVNGLERMRITSGGNVLIGTSTDAGYKLDVNGNVRATGFFNSSDNRLKDLIDYDYNVSDIKPITYLWKDGRDNKKHVGYSAQEVQKVMPDAVNEDEKGFLSVNYVEVLVAQVNFLTKRIEELEKIVSK